MNNIKRSHYPVFENKAEDAGSHLKEENDCQEYGILWSQKQFKNLRFRVKSSN